MFHKRIVKFNSLTSIAFDYLSYALHFALCTNYNNITIYYNILLYRLGPVNAVADILIYIFHNKSIFYLRNKT